MTSLVMEPRSPKSLGKPAAAGRLRAALRLDDMGQLGLSRIGPCPTRVHRCEGEYGGVKWKGPEAGTLWGSI